MAFEREMQVLKQAEDTRQAVGPISDLVPGGLRRQHGARLDAEVMRVRQLRAGLPAEEELVESGAQARVLPGA